MAWFQKTISLPPKSRGSYLVTDTVVAQLPEIKQYKVGLLHLFVQHTSCALSMNENWDEDVRADMSDALDRIVPTDKKGDLYLIELAPGETRWVTEDDKWALKREGINFMDITATPDLGTFGAQTTYSYPSAPSQQSIVEPLLSNLSQKNLRSNLEVFTAFHTRYYKSSSGAESSAWLQARAEEIVHDSGAKKHGASVSAFTHPWGQNTVVATIPGRSNKTVVIGAHQDSINLFLPSLLAAPGADDDGSGTVTILEALRVLLTIPEIARGEANNTIEFHWYSAEEGGLLGSQALFSTYQQQGRQVVAMLQQDMTGYVARAAAAGQPESVGIVMDFVDPGLTRFIKAVVGAYCEIPFVETKCGYACSDHASASKAGYPSAFVLEGEFKYSDPKVHTTGDVIDLLDFGHMVQHARLTLGVAVELAFTSF
ncbi:Zn-dependent exopeptidase [Trichodelitschia bisporula]|uniref:Peptide hydrolase n=1 Tax=Trichodelitschia bisporula TaxID=703511 RepID=A0A6G1I4R5_9PEZI|nr:Zn-dependent exopeptidase [Trichodelitschia bisporula]